MNHIDSKYTRYLYYLLPVLFWIILVSTSKDFILQVEERSLFLYDWFWIKGLLNIPAGILTLTSLFLSQFLHLPWLGSLIWVILLGLATVLTAKIFNLTKGFNSLALIPAFLLAGANVSLGYLLYIMNTPGYFFLPTLGYLIILATVVVFRRIQSNAVLIPSIIIWGIAGYYAAGYYALVGLLASGIDLLTSKKGNAKYVPILTAAASIIIAPVLLFGLTTYNLSLGWIQGIPTALYEETHQRTFIPVITATLIPAILPLIKKLTGKESKHPTMIQIPVLSVCIIMLYLSWAKDINFRTELKMIQATQELDWDKSVKAMQEISDRADKHKTYQPTRVMVLLKDLALIKKGQESQTAFSFEDGGQKQKNNYEIPMVLQIGKELYLHYGIPGFCHRWCLEETGEFGWSYTHLQYLTMASLCMDDRVLTIKYLDMLDKTMFYRGWSARQRKLLQNPDEIQKSSPYDKIIPLVCYSDKLDDDQRGCEYTLLSHFTGPQPDNATPLYDRVALFWALKSQDSRVFLSKLFLYLSSNNIEKLDRYYQEAAYLFSNLKNDETLMELPYDKYTKDLFSSFINTAQKKASDIQSLQDARQIFSHQLRSTYYYYYYFVRGLETF